jgi:hypothetical protein
MAQRNQLELKLTPKRQISASGVNSTHVSNHLHQEKKFDSWHQAKNFFRKNLQRQTFDSSFFKFLRFPLRSRLLNMYVQGVP